MAIFNPEPNPTNDPNYLNQSRGTSSYEADLSVGRALSGAGDLIGATAKGGVAVISNQIEDRARAGVVNETNPIMKAYEDIANRGGPTVGGVDPNGPMDISPNAQYAPRPLTRSMEPMNKLVEAHNQGKLDPAYYAARLQSLVRDLKSEYPGFESVVDDKVKKLTGIVPANALVASVFANSELQKSNQQKEKDAISGELRKHVANGDISATVLRDFDTGRINKYQALDSISQVTSLDAQNKRELNRLAVDAANKKDITESATSFAENYAGGLVSKRFGVMMDNVGGGNNLLNKIQLSQAPGGPKMSAQEMVDASNLIAQQKTKTEMEMRNYYTQPRDELGGRSLQATIGSNKVNEIIKNALAPYDTIQSNLGFEKIGLAASAANFTQVLQSQDMAQILPKSTGLRLINVYSKAGGQAGVGAYMQYGGGLQTITNEARSIGDFFHFGTATNEYSMKDMLPTIKKFQEKYPEQSKAIPLQALVGGNVHELTDPKTAGQIAEGLTNSMFGPKNRGFTAQFQDQDRIQLWNMMTSPAVSEKIKTLSASNPQLMQNYQDWVREEFLNTMQGSVNYIQNNLQYSPGVEGAFDPKHGTLVITKDPYGNEQGEAGNFLRQQVGQLNIGLMNMKHALTLGGMSDEEATMQVMQLMMRTGLNPDVKKEDTFFGSVLKSIGAFGTNASENFSNSAKEGVRAIGNAAVTPAGAQENQSLVQRTASIESGNNPNAKASTSTATGSGQFIEGTWLDLMKRNRPDLTEGKSKQEILAMRTNDGLSREMIGNYARENSDALRKAGLQATPGNIYLAHFAGSSGAIKILQADPHASAAKILGPEATKANPWLARFTAQGLREWAEGKMRGVRG